MGKFNQLRTVFVGVDSRYDKTNPAGSEQFRRDDQLPGVGHCPAPLSDIIASKVTELVVDLQVREKAIRLLCRLANPLNITFVVRFQPARVEVDQLHPQVIANEFR